MPNDEPNGVTIEELSTAVDLPVRTIRYYVAEGLIAGPGGRGKAALYGDDQAERLRLIRRLSSERLPLAEIRKRLAGLTTDDVTALLREEESRSTEIERARGAPSPKDYIAALLRNARAARAEPAIRAPSYSVQGAPRPQRAILESPPDFATSDPARSTWEHWELAPGIVLHIRADARQPYRDLIDRLLREAERPNAIE
jgi:DNA-binding transcriptional MerR regulator